MLGIHQRALVWVGEVVVVVDAVGFLADSAQPVACVDGEGSQHADGVWSAGLSVGAGDFGFGVLAVLGEVVVVGLDRDGSIDDVGVVAGADPVRPVGVVSVAPVEGLPSSGVTG